MASIRAATIADVRGISDVDVETWRASYAGVLPDPMLVGLSGRQRSASWMRFITRRPGDVMVAVEGEQVVGFGSCGLQRDAELPFAGEIFTLYIEPDFQGKDIGRQLLVSLFARLIRCGLYSSLVWVLKQNPSRFFYERLGGRPVATQRIEMSRGVSVDAIAYAWRDLPDAVQSRGRAKSRTG